MSNGVFQMASMAGWTLIDMAVPTAALLLVLWWLVPHALCDSRDEVDRLPNQTSYLAAGFASWRESGVAPRCLRSALVGQADRGKAER